MTKAEVATLIGIIKARYPRAQWGPDDALTVEAWHMSLGDLPLEPVLGALRALFTRSPFPPDPADVRSWLAADSGLAPEPDEAWAIARRAMRDYYPGVRAAGPMPAAVRRAVEAVGGVRALCLSETPGKDREAFVRAYTIERKRALETAMLDDPALGEPGSRALPGGPA